MLPTLLATLEPLSRPEPAPAVSWAPFRHDIEARLAVLLGDPPGGGSPVTAAMRYGTLSPGKRVRPLLLLLAARSLGVCTRSVIDVACALEMLHAASLYLDDLPCMDDATSRRGQPTVHAVFGEDVATLSAVALLTHALHTVATTPALPSSIRASMVAALTGAVGVQGLVAGQCDDLHAHVAGMSADSVEQINDRKTGALFAVAFELAAIAADSDPPVRLAMRQAALELGRAFQLADDLADAEVDARAVPAGDPSAPGRATVVARLGIRRTRQRLDGHVSEAERLIALAVPGGADLLELTRAMFAPAAAVSAA